MSIIFEYSIYVQCYIHLYCSTIERRYSDVCDTVNTRGILSLGIACFQWIPGQHDNNSTPSLPTSTDSQAHTITSPHNISCTISDTEELHIPSNPDDSLPIDSTKTTNTAVDVKVFNIWLLCQRPYTIDPSSAKFLLEHGFDFNKQFAKGIPYTPGPLHVSKPICMYIHARNCHIYAEYGLVKL